MRGRKPQPTVLKRLHGRTHHARLNAAEPIPPNALDVPPDWLTAAQKDGWVWALSNIPPGLLRRLDRGLLAVWVIAEDTHRQAAIRLREQTALLMQGPGQPVPFPSLYLGIMNKQALIMIKAASELGFSPAARARIYATPTEPLTQQGPLIEGKASRTRTPLAQYIANAPARPKMH